MTTPDAVLAMLRGQVTDIVAGTIFLSIGAAACAIAAIRWRSGARILVWWGIWSGMYGVQTLIRTPAVLPVLPDALKHAAPYAGTAIGYLILVAALLAWRELSLGPLRFVLQLGIIAASAVAVAGMAAFVLTGSDEIWTLCNSLLALFAVLALLTAVMVPRFARKFLVLPDRGILAAGTLIFAFEALCSNLSGVLLHYRVPPIADSLSFAALLLSLGYVALETMFGNERRLLSIETELETARQIQSSILPASVPENKNIRIAASYHPMTAVAGDFYQFVQIDENHLGILVADVSGHGIPAALIASMIKVAMQSVAAFAHDPAQVLGGLNRILSSEARGQLTSAAYVWIDTENRTALYSAAGHPPLLCWRNGRDELQRIESNGLLFGIKPDAEYPVCTVPVEPGDRLLLYTDGITEPENAAGEAFGDWQLERVVRENRLQPASELSRQLLSEIRKWRPASVSQQDDITLIIVDIV
ncbi:MAG: PP2C family protein-serine/threonine phosphatase [Bryobacteraceae bacterium]